MAGADSEAQSGVKLVSNPHINFHFNEVCD